MNKIHIKITNNITWIWSYDFACTIFFVPVTTYIIYKLKRHKNKQLAEHNRLIREQKIRKMQQLYKVIKAANLPLTSEISLQMLCLRAGALHELHELPIPGVEDCVTVETPSYVDNERILRFLNDYFSKFNINGIIYITKEALCYLVENQGLVDFPFVFLERVRIDGVLSFTKRASQYGVVSIAAILGVVGFVHWVIAILIGGVGWNYIGAIPILEPAVTKVEELTGKFIPRIGDRKDAVVFDAKQEPLPPALEPSVKQVSVSEVETEFEITDNKLVDVSKVSKLRNHFDDRRFRRRNKAKMVNYSDKKNEWPALPGTYEEEPETIGKLIEQVLEDGLI